MPRRPRIDFEGAWHHVVNRGASHARVFDRPQDYQLFLDCAVEGMRRYGIEIHCYCLMPNHFHLLLRSLEGKLPEAMRFASGRFTRLKNTREGRDGPIFRGRYHSSDILTETHLVQGSRYIHCNPVSAGLVAGPDHWPWSSAAAYLGTQSRPPWLSMATVLELFGPSEAQRDNYKAFLNEGVDPDTLRRYGEIET